ncbi:hypothetical protein KUCAC02_026738 [Chaenocephalus aceratus]|nr:hypothetical protein KUCAC02_026738 [Chaenocephalus aceratus]
MSGDGNGDGLCSDGAPEFIPPRVSRGRRSGVTFPGGGDQDSIILESVRAAPRRSSIIKLSLLSKQQSADEVVGCTSGQASRSDMESSAL